MINSNKKLGCWKCSDNSKFERKFDALYHATKNKLDVLYSFHDEIFDALDKKLLGKVSLNQLYKERAQQLRDSYKYLILYYSGGSDSHNILMTFINNNIKLDEIIVKWPKELIDGKFYTPNTADRSQKNIWSEWNFSIKPQLDWLSVKHPEIKITIQDYTPSITNKNLETYFEKVDHTRLGIIQTFTKYNTISKEDSAHIIGADKPILAIHDNNVYMVFTDIAITAGQHAACDYDNDNYVLEPFYWSPDFPVLACEMAYQLSEHFNIDKTKRKFLWPIDTIKKQMSFDSPGLNIPFASQLLVQYQNNITKKMCYLDTWDNRFQADKSVSATRQDKWFWFFDDLQFKEQKEAFVSSVKSICALVDDKFVIKAEHNSTPSVKTLTSKLFFIRKLEE